MNIPTSAKKTIIALTGAVFLGSAMVAAPTAAFALPPIKGPVTIKTPLKPMPLLKPAKPMPMPGKHSKHWGHRHGYGYLGAGLALGAIAAASAGPTYAEDCYVVRRAVTDDFGNVYIRKVHVCE
jgi:hypothetical protein